MKKRSTMSWILTFTGRKKGTFIGSIILAIAGVACSFIPYLLIIKIIENLLSGNRDWNFYFGQILWMALS